ncbi:MAG: PIG-L deacetylase family protein [Actinomycetota bacterium]
MFDVGGIARALIIAPHADDEVLGCGGLMAALADHGADVRVLYATLDGMTHAGHGAVSYEERRREVADVAELFGFDWEVLYENQDAVERLDVMPRREVVSWIERHVRSDRPQLVLVPSGGDYDQDHQEMFAAAVAALRPIAPSFGGWIAPMVLVYESSKLTWSTIQPERPSVFHDISDTLDRKLQGLATYRSQARVAPHVRSPEAVTALAEWRGTEIGVRYAEAYALLRATL